MINLNMGLIKWMFAAISASLAACGELCTLEVSGRCVVFMTQPPTPGVPAHFRAIVRFPDRWQLREFFDGCGDEDDMLLEELEVGKSDQNLAVVFSQVWLDVQMIHGCRLPHRIIVPSRHLALL
ncbi:MAG: hypothetical protein A3C11_03010 [Candidatus Sungbacteria bacterium RIFCSPHIGHO2_02_FULL_49_12]|uniref:Secreted protein n=1 Tax=Candidatus Sungbacteria bacterium RIFCSPHIGHO2_02_FULL_49_12 TaxID=1802271 RepID=A0A1G2KRR5_9BACT|nr:MAG: hypothetical protein A3C11_03010 [Candidatus Sungbacteria bacterium RIFCSPHIGHO2_02_FULL_49_12]